jgi:hypothetical protein
MPVAWSALAWFAATPDAACNQGGTGSHGPVDPKIPDPDPDPAPPRFSPAGE